MGNLFSSGESEEARQARQARQAQQVQQIGQAMQTLMTPEVRQAIQTLMNPQNQQAQQFQQPQQFQQTRQVQQTRQARQTRQVQKPSYNLFEGEFLRQEAQNLFDEAKEISRESQEEYMNGSRARAKILSNTRAELHKEAKRINQQAAKLIFEHHNQGQADNRIDLHGLHIKEALQYLQDKINKCRSKNIAKLTVITGAGYHSKDNIAKIKPEVERFANRNRLQFQVYPGHIDLYLAVENSTVPPNNPNSYDCCIQ